MGYSGLVLLREPITAFRQQALRAAWPHTEQAEKFQAPAPVIPINGDPATMAIVPVGWPSPLFVYQNTCFIVVHGLAPELGE